MSLVHFHSIYETPLFYVKEWKMQQKAIVSLFLGVAQPREFIH